jgi:anti-anti-sigma regulatory factor
MKQARAAGGDLRLCSLSDDVRAVFDLTRLSTVLVVHPDRQQAFSEWD